jgi:hypothetical protein
MAYPGIGGGGGESAGFVRDIRKEERGGGSAGEPAGLEMTSAQQNDVRSRNLGSERMTQIWHPTCMPGTK